MSLAPTGPQSIEHALAEIGKGLANERGHGFLPGLVEHLGRAVGTRYAVLCQLVDPTASPSCEVSVVAMWSRDGGVQEGLTRRLEGTPCAAVLDGTPTLLRDGVQEAYPDDALLTQLGVVGYAGAPVYDSRGVAIGILGVLDSEPLRHPELIEPLLGILAKLAGVELERAQASASLRASESRQAEFLDSAPFGVYYWQHTADDQLILEGTNAAARSAAWMPLDELIGKPLEEAFPFLTDTELPSAYRSVARTGQLWTHPHLEVGDDEHRVVLELYAFPLGGGRVAVMFNDITERISNQQALQKSEALLKAFLHNAPFGAYILEVQPGDDGEPRLALVGGNPAAEQVSGVPFAELVGREVRDAFPPIVRTELPRIVQEVAGGARPYHDPRMPFEGMGLTGVYDVHVYPSGPSRAAILFRDVTGLARAEEAERAAERLEATATLAGGLAHELNNLMAGVLSGVSLLRRGRPGSRRYDEALGQVTSAAARASELAHQLVAYARGGKYESWPLDLNAAVAEIVRRYRASLPETVRLRTDLDDALSHIAADRSQLQLLLRCLLSNAIEAVDPAQGLVVVQTRERVVREEEATRLEVDPGTYAVIAVADSGPGVALDLGERIFEPFFSTRAQGRGMGLAAALGIARNHGGALELVTTHAPPLAAPPAETPAPTPRAPLTRPDVAPNDSDSGPCPPPEACGGALFTVYLPLQESRGSFTVSDRDPPSWLQASGVLEGVGSLALSVAHDFNNLLAVALNELDLLRRQPTPEPHADAERLRVVHETVLKCRTLTERLLQLGRGEEYERASLSLNEVVKDVAALLRGALEATIELELDLEPDLPTVHGSRMLLENALLNLCFNARDALAAGGTLRLETRALAAAEEVSVLVSDTGVGMTEEVLRRSREPLFTTKSDQGTGLGLAMVDRVARNHGGRLSVTSSPGQGTQVTVTLPAAGAAEPVVRDRRQILLIDDSEHLARSTTQLLELEGFEVDTVHRGEDALARFEAGSYDLVILDVVLPGISGEAVFEQLRAARPDLPVVICSGYGQQEQVGALVDQGAVFLGKPFLLEELLARIDEALGA